MERVIIQKYTKEWLEDLCVNSYSYMEVLRKAGRKIAGGSCETLKNKIEEFGIDISHFTGQRWFDTPGKVSNFTGQSKEKYKFDEIFIKNSPVRRKVIREYIKRHNLLEYKCEKCNCDGKWQDGEISLELDHINGDNTDNRLENLRYLCPNCHALTDTYRGRNIRLKNIKNANQ